MIKICCVDLYDEIKGLFNYVYFVKIIWILKCFFLFIIWEMLYVLKIVRSVCVLSKSIEILIIGNF